MLLVNKEHLEDEVLKSIQKKAESIMPKDAKVILFGSRARRDAKADSDWDILVLLNKDKIDEQDHDNYTYPLWELRWQINQMIHPIVYSMKDWQSKKGSPFYNNVEEEGVMLLQNSGALLITSVPRALPWAKSFWTFSPFLNHLQCSVNNLCSTFRELCA